MDATMECASVTEGRPTFADWPTARSRKGRASLYTASLNAFGAVLAVLIAVPWLAVVGGGASRLVGKV
jgi:hypothetical protein